MKDVSDLHAALGREHTLRAIEAHSAPVEYAANDAGRAQQFVDAHRDAVRYVPAFRRWLMWAGHHWRADEDGGITRLAVQHSQQLIVAAARIGDHDKRAARVREAVQMGNMPVIGAMLELAGCDERIVVRQSALDGDPFLLGVQNGVIELRTGTFRAGRREDLVTKRAGAVCEPGAECPRWRTFLEEVLAGDEALVRYLQKLVGYTLTGAVSGQCFPFLYGGGKNGKSVFTETLHALLGDYAQRAPQSLLTASANGREPINEIARLHGARLVIGSETEEGSRLAESRVKDLTGGDTLTGRFLYAEAFDFKPQLKLWMFGNHKPEIRGADEGIWRRVRLIPFVVQIGEEKRDPHLAARLAGELPGILNWALEGTLLWLREGLIPPAAVVEASSEYRVEEDTLGDFIREEIELEPGSRTETGQMYARYQSWSESGGLRYPLSQRALTKRLNERGLRLIRSNGQRLWEGIGLKHEQT